MQSLEDAKESISVSHVEADTVVTNEKHILTLVYTLANTDDGLLFFPGEFDGIGQ